ncbi:MAG: hypothetical protein QOD10_1627, partial [Mycobacterium sp.]|nr:hypothetical protein [Mycobacterium sp.]
MAAGQNPTRDRLKAIRADYSGLLEVATDTGLEAMRILIAASGAIGLPPSMSAVGRNPRDRRPPMDQPVAARGAVSNDTCPGSTLGRRARSSRSAIRGSCESADHASRSSDGARPVTGTARTAEPN